MISKTRSLLKTVLAAAVVSSILLATPLSPAWAGRKMADNNKFVPKADGESNVTGYIIVVAGIMMGMTAICRRSYQSTDPKRNNEG